MTDCDALSGRHLAPRQRGNGRQWCSPGQGAWRRVGDRVGGGGIVDAKAANFGASQRGQVRTGTEHVAEVAGDAADVRTGPAGDVELGSLRGNVEVHQRDSVNSNLSSRDGNGLTTPKSPVGPFPIDVDSAGRWGNLLNLTDEGR